MSKITDSISKTSNEFSFISTFFDLVGNKEFKKAELSTMYTTSETAQTSLWRSLSAVAEKLGREFYDSTLNFIDNIANIDLCKVSQLQSLIKMLGIDYTVFANIADMPVDIVKLLDLLSVKKEYLANYAKMDSKFVKDILSGGKFDDVGYVAGCTLPSAWSQPAEASCNVINAARNEWLVLDPQMSSYWSTADAVSCEVPLDDAAVDNYISAAFYSLLSSKV
jgi:VIT1/CCC1 family predicted Fe2+/Mn2+ transporter